MSLAKRKLKDMFISVYGDVSLMPRAYLINLNQLVYGELTGKCVGREACQDCKTRPADCSIDDKAKEIWQNTSRIQSKFTVDCDVR